MKCIKWNDFGTIERLRDEEAHNAVSDGHAVYVPKHEWKKATRIVETREQWGERIAAKIRGAL